MHDSLEILINFCFWLAHLFYSIGWAKKRPLCLAAHVLIMPESICMIFLAYFSIRPDSSLRYRRYINHLLTYLLIYAFNLPDPVTLGGAYDGSLQGHVICCNGW